MSRPIKNSYVIWGWTHGTQTSGYRCHRLIRASVSVVSVSWSFDEQPRTGDPLLPGASPAAIRAALLADDKAGFDTAYAHALGTARDQLDLSELLRCLEHWRRRALLQRDPEDFAALVRRASERLTGRPVPEGEPLAQTRQRIGM